MKRLVVFLFVMHFAIVTISVLDNIHVLPQNLITDVVKLYTIPFFEQNWGMFSNPPTTTRKVYFQFHTPSSDQNNKIEISDWYDINATIYSYNKDHLFSIAQRLIKYESGCLNNIFSYIEKCKDPTPDACIAYSPGFLSLKNYARIIYANSTDNAPSATGVKFVIKIVEEHFPRYEDRALDYFDKKNYEYATHTTIPYELN